MRLLEVTGTWTRLHRAESGALVALLNAEERAAVARRLGRTLPTGSSWVPPVQAGGGARFAEPGGPGALYLGNTLETCVAEVQYHHGRICSESVGTPAGTRATFRQLVFSVSGSYADASGDRRGGLHDPGSYAASWAYARKARAAGLPGVHYRSVRRRGGRCLAVFAAAAVRFLRQEWGAVVLEWDGEKSVRIA
nr:RES family NAD+ phosphorylase [uncultured Holophaga sp.]